MDFEDIALSVLVFTFLTYVVFSMSACDRRQNEQELAVLKTYLGAGYCQSESGRWKPCGEDR